MIKLSLLYHSNTPLLRLSSFLVCCFLFRSRFRFGACLACRCASRGFFFRLALRFPCFPRLNGDLVRKHDANVTSALENPTGAAAGTRHDSLQRRSFPDGRFLYHQTVWFEVGVVLGVGDCALQRLADQKRRFLRSEREQV